MDWGQADIDLAGARTRDAVLIDQPTPHALRGVTLLARRLDIRDKPLVDELAVLAQLRRRPPLR